MILSTKLFTHCSSETKHHNFGMLLNNGVATVEFVVELPLLTSLDVDIKAAKILTLSLLFTLDNFFLMGEANAYPMPI